MADKKYKLVYISNIPAPYQIAWAKEISKYFNFRFLFYSDIDASRPDWWKVPLPDNCRILRKVVGKRIFRYYSFDLKRELNEFSPDIVMIGGFLTPGNYAAYRWAVKNHKKVIVFTETMRKTTGLRKKSIFSLMLGYLYRRIDGVLTSSVEAAEQMKRLLPNLADKVVASRYPSDIDRYFKHDIRKPGTGGCKIIFPNRLVEQYNPLGALEIFAEILEWAPEATLKMNADGEQKNECVKMISRLGLEDKVAFLDQIKHWDDLSEIYKDADIFLFPAKFSNGNFTIIEAMASGMGIVISDKIIGADHYKIESGVNGFICSDTAGFVAAVKEYYQNPDMFKTHAAINRQNIRFLGAAATAEFHYNQIMDIADLDETSLKNKEIV